MNQKPIIRCVKAIALLAALTALAPLAFAEEGLASWYGGRFHGRLTSSGEVFDTNDMTAAHKSLPFGTMVRVTNQENGKTAVVKINDRGPFVEGRIIDLSRAAAVELGMIDSGVAHVSLQILDFVSSVDLFAVQVGAYGTEKNAEKAAAMLTGNGFFVTTEKSSLGMTRVFVRALSSQELEEARKRLVKLGFSNYLVRRERTELPREAQVMRP